MGWLSTLLLPLQANVLCTVCAIYSSARLAVTGFGQFGCPFGSVSSIRRYVFVHLTSCSVGIEVDSWNFGENAGAFLIVEKMLTLFKLRTKCWRFSNCLQNADTFQIAYKMLTHWCSFLSAFCKQFVSNLSAFSAIKAWTPAYSEHKKSSQILRWVVFIYGVLTST